MSLSKRFVVLLVALAVAGLTAPGLAAAQTVVGVTATEIKVGNTNPYSGPASAYGTIGKAIGAYFKKVNDEGGINGRKINYISYDDQYTPPKTVEMVRKLVEQDQVALLFQTLGTPPNSAIHKYMNEKKVPHLFVATGATKWNDPKNFPWTMGFQPMSFDFLMACTANFGMVMLKKTLAPLFLRLTICESMVGSVTS